MKQKIKMIVLLCIISAFFSACGKNDGKISSESKIENDIESKSDNYVVTTEEYQLSLDEFICTPFILNNKILATNVDTYYLLNTSKTIIYNTNTNEEQVIPNIFTMDPVMDDNFIYYANHDGPGGNTTEIRKRNIQPDEDILLYQTDKDYRIAAKLNIMGSYLAWYEYKPVADSQILSDDGKNEAFIVDLVVFDITLNKVVFKKQNIAVLNTYVTIPLVDNNKIIYCTQEDSDYVITIYDFINNKEIFKENCSSPPLSYDYDGDVLAVSLLDGVDEDLFIYDLSSNKKTVIDSSCGGVAVIDGRFLVYGKMLGVNIIDIKNNETVFTTIDQKAYMQGNIEKRYITTHRIDKINKKILVQFTDQKDKQYVLVIELKKENTQ